jgi:predicted dithiol-disulfide oxidoreductase (DUF899 family)
MSTRPTVWLQEWEAAHQQFLVTEKAFTRSRDALAAERPRMPWLAVDQKYEFEGPKGKVSLVDTFEGRRQLIVYRVFFEPGCSAGLSECPRRHPRLCLTRAAGGHRAPEGADGLEVSVVHHHRQLRQGLRRR